LDSIHHRLNREHDMATNINVDITAAMNVDIAIDMTINIDVDVRDDMDTDSPCFYRPVSSGSNILMDHFRPNNYFNSTHF
jgi:hypothetical protein